jgi:phage terminase small subunit
MPDTPTLPPKHERFVAEYLVDLCATQAAIRAGYSKASAHVQAHRLLKNAKVAAAIAAARQRLIAKVEASAERIVAEYARIAFGDVRRVLSWGASGVVTVRPSAELTDDEAAMIAEVHDLATANGRSLKLKLADKLHALDSLARHLGMFVEKREHAGPRGGPIPISEGTIIVTGDEAEYVATLQKIRAQDRERAAAGPSVR